MTYPSRTPEGRRAYRGRIAAEAERQQLELIAERTRVQLWRDSVNQRVRFDLVDTNDEVLARFYMNFDRCRKFIKAIANAVTA